MVVVTCHVCQKKPYEAERYKNSGFHDGHVCPVCYRPTCSHHLATVRWRWKNASRERDAAKVCIECKTAYRHRSWDPFHREWIS